MLKLQVWPRADGMTEVEWPGGCTRFGKRETADAFVEGFRAAHRSIRDSVRELDVEDRRPIERAPTT